MRSNNLTANICRHIAFSPPDISDLEVEEVVKTLRSGWITTGPKTKLLERRLAAFIETGKNDVDCISENSLIKYSDRVVCLNSATAAEELNLRILGIKEGDEVIVPAYTYTASASAAIHCGAKIIFADIANPNGADDTHMPEMDYEAVGELITNRTKAVITADIGGIVCNYEKLFKIVEEKRNLYQPLNEYRNKLSSLNSRIQHSIGRVAVVADSAHSLGASRLVRDIRRNTGQIADFTSFSFHAVKNFTTAEGGASTWLQLGGIDNHEIYQFYQLLSLHGQNKDALSKTMLGSWEYDIIGPWYKCNMTDIMAAIGLRQLDRYPALLKRRREIIRCYDDMCDEIGIQHMNHYTEEMKSSGHLYVIRIPGINVEKRNEIIRLMAAAGVVCNVHYKPLPMMTAYRKYVSNVKDYQNSYKYFENLITLPLHTLLTNEDIEYVIACFKNVIKMYVKNG